MQGAAGGKAAKFYFEDGFGSRTDRSYQVTRAKFDKILLDHAAENGAEVREETSVENVEFTIEEGAAFLRRDALSRIPGLLKHVSREFGRNMSSTRAGATPSLALISS